MDVGNVGVTISNAGYLGRSGVRSNPTGPPSFEYPLDSGIEHLFEAGLWVGARRADGVVSVRTGSVTTSGGYSAGASGFEFTPLSPIGRRSTLPESEAFTRLAVSHLDYSTTFTDTASVLPGTQIATPDPAGSLGMTVNLRTHAWSFPFADAFVILNYDIINTSAQPWDSVYVGIWHDLVVRNINTTTDTGSNYFNKGGYGTIDTLMTSYNFNAGGTEESLNTYGALVVLGAEWRDPATGRERFVIPALRDEFVRDGLTPPQYTPRWWLFSGSADPDLGRPGGDEARFRRMNTHFPDPLLFETEAAYLEAREAWYERLRTDGQSSVGNWIGLSSLGPFSTVSSGDTLTVSFALVAALKPDEFQDISFRPLDTPETRRPLVENVLWARRTFAGEDNNYNGRLDAGEDANGNGVLDRYLIPEPPSSPRIRPVLEEGKVVLYWDRSSEQSRDPVTGEFDFEGYRLYRSNPGDDRFGDFLDRATIIAQYDRADNLTGYNNDFEDVELDSPVFFEGDTTAYVYRFVDEQLLSGWQYAYAVTAFDEGDPLVGLPPFESSRVANVARVFPGTPAATDQERNVGVYPNPYRINAAWDGATAKTRKLNFYNLPERCEIRVYTLAGEIVSEMSHEGSTYQGDIRWYDDFGGQERLMPGGEHSWDILSENGLSLSPGLYLYSVKDLDSGDLQTGKFAIIK